MTDLVCVLALARPPRRDVGLERNLDHDDAADPRDLGEQGRRIGHVLEHVREDPEVVGAVGVSEVQAVIQRHRLELWALGGDRDGSLGDLDTEQASTEAAIVQLAEQGAVAAADLERAARADGATAAEREHVIGLADRPERAPAGVLP